MSSLVNNLIRDGHLRTDAVIDAFSKIPRIEFVPIDLAERADVDMPLPIGHGQTISQPQTVAFMMELLEPKSGQHILDVGSGSGWTTALLAHIVGEGGLVIAMEKIKELCEFGKKNVDKFSFIKKGVVQFHCQSAENGFEKKAPYDRILVSASVKEIPIVLQEQLSIGGKMVVPVLNEIWKLQKQSADEFKIEKFPGYVFVPFVKSHE